MNQTKKRLAIIELAISLTDTQTIKLQILKLGMLQTDDRVHEIMELLNAKKYAQSQLLIAAYINSPTETNIIQEIHKDESIDEMEPEYVKEVETKSIQDVDYTDLLNVNVNNVLLDNTSLNIVEIKDDNFVNDEEEVILKEEIPKNTTSEYTDEQKMHKDESIDKMGQEYVEKVETKPMQDIDYTDLLNANVNNVLLDNTSLNIDEIKDDDFINDEEEVILKEEIPKNTTSEYADEQEMHKEENFEHFKIDTQYKAIPYIEEKLQNMQVQYPALHTKEEIFSSVSSFISDISTKGYTELSIEKILLEIESLKSTNKAEAAQLLLVTGGTESKYARFNLARELFKGELLERNIPESFTLISRLATNENYPEAICDLAQFYDNGVGTEKDTQKAQELYKEAMDLGIHRAIRHYERLTKQDKGRLSFFKRQ